MSIVYEKQSNTELKEIYTPPSIEVVYSVAAIDAKILELQDEIARLIIIQEEQMKILVEEKAKWDERKTQCAILEVE